MTKYPQELLNWSGDKAGGVKKLFYAGSGRPSGQVITTPLLTRLQAWASDTASGADGAPRAVFLIGGPGNGKTEAVEFTIRALDASMNLRGALIEEFSAIYSGRSGEPSGRLVRAERASFPRQAKLRSVAIVQDGSEVEPGDPTTPAAHLCNDIKSILEQGSESVYVACVNRGVLDDALILATERDDQAVGDLIKTVVQSVSLGARPIQCWPLAGYPSIAVWPMDVESLVEESEGSASAASQILSIATEQSAWPAQGACPAGDLCPFCTNRRLLAGEPHRSSFVRILRWYELSSGKRWNFRDLFSLTAYLLAGSVELDSNRAYNPCDWAQRLSEPADPNPRRREVMRVRGLYKLASAQYQHALFGAWPVERAAALKNAIKDLKLEDLPALVGLQQFLSLEKRKEATSTLRTQLAGVRELLDPAIASPSLDVAASGNTTIKFEELDRRFSLSIKEGRMYLQKYQCLSSIEVELLKTLEDADGKLSEDSVRRRKPAVAERVQGLVRSIACSIARRSIGVRSGITKESDVLFEYNQIHQGGGAAIQVAMQQLENLLNKDRRFLISLNTTFGEPLPPPERRAILTTDIQKVRQMPNQHDDRRPRSPVRFLSIGAGRSLQAVALTYELFKATKSLRKGLIPASLPRAVVALLDTTRAKLAGAIVRDEDALEGGEIELGIRNDVIVRNFGTFVVRTRDGR